EEAGLPFASQAGKNLFRRQEAQDLVALVRALADPRDTLALGALLRGPLVGLTEHELLSITEKLPALDGGAEFARLSLQVDPTTIEHDVAREILTSPTRMKKISFSGYRFPAEIIRQAIWLHLRFTLGLRDVEDLLAERGVAVSYETVRRWVSHFGPMIATDLRKRRLKPLTTWHLDEVYLKIEGRMVYLWRAVDAEGEVLDVLVQSKRNKHAALKLRRKLLKKYAFVPERLVTDDLRSYSAAVRDLGIE